MKKERFDAMASATKTIESEFGQQLFEATQRKAKDGFENVVISESRDPIRARRDAERLAKLLGLAVEDHVGETVSRREHNELDQSLRERLRQKRSAPTLAAADYSSKKLTITDHGGDKEYQFLCVPYGLSFSIFGGLIFFFFALDGFAFESPLPAINDFFSVAFGDYARLASVVIIVMLVLALLFVCFGKYVITVDRHTIEVDMRFLGITVRPGRSLSVDELEEVAIDKSTLVLISDTKRIQIHTTRLTVDDVQHLHDSLVFTLSR